MHRSFTGPHGAGSRLWDKRAPFMHRPYSGPRPRLWDTVGPVYATREAPFMQQRRGPVYGTKRTRLWDRIEWVVCEGWLGAEAPNMGWNWGGWVFKGFPLRGEGGVGG